MFITFFCKRDKHLECPSKWPINETCDLTEDCSFDIKMIDCECSCHFSNIQYKSMNESIRDN
jgi:hypothetical protein